MERAYLEKLQKYYEEGLFSKELRHTCEVFFLQFEEALAQAEKDPASMSSIFSDYLDLVAQQLRSPYPFEPFHSAIREPYDYYQFGSSVVRPLMDREKSTLHSPTILGQIAAQIAQGDNVIFLSNHQTEPDPQVLSIMLQEEYPRLAEDLIFVAGHRVTTDPFSVPYSLGRNLVCIHSKKYINQPPEQRAEKQDHNRRAMKQLGERLQEGGCCIWVAPSGGRDRPDETGQLQIAPFDPQSLEMFRLLALQSGRPTHFYPLALYTYDLLPPPDRVSVELGEPRTPKTTPVHLYFQNEVDLSMAPEEMDKRSLRQWRADHVHHLVCEAYDHIRQLLKN